MERVETAGEELEVEKLTMFTNYSFTVRARTKVFLFTPRTRAQVFKFITLTVRARTKVFFFRPRTRAQVFKFITRARIEVLCSLSLP